MTTTAISFATHGKVLGSIGIPIHADRVIRFAATELHRYLKAISGAEFPIRRQPRVSGFETPAVYLGCGEWDSALGTSLDPCRDPLDGFTLHSKGKAIFIRGHNSRSALYGAYAFLEDLGCEFVEPGIEYIPRKPNLAIRVRPCRETSAFPLRTIFPNLNHAQKYAPFTALDSPRAVQQIDWMAKRRLNHHNFYVNFYRYDLWEKHKHKVLDALLDRGFDLEVTHHSIHYFCPPDENHDYGDYGPATYLRNHPDWYVPGLECGGRGRWQTRVEKPAVQKVLIERLLAYFERNPELKIVGLWPDDIPINAPYAGMNATDGYVKFWNRVGQALGCAFPNQLLAIIAYFDITSPPQIQKPRSNLHCWYCPIGRSLNVPMDHPKARRFLAWLKGWIQVCAPYRVADFEYYGWQMDLSPLRYVMQRDLAIYQELRLGGIYGWSGFSDMILGEDYRWAIEMVTLAHLLWNPGADLAKIEQTWAARVFGSAGSRILDFHAFLKRIHDREVKRGLAPNYQWIEIPHVRTGLDLLAKASRQAETDQARRRIKFLAKRLCWGCAEELLREGETRVV